MEKGPGEVFGKGYKTTEQLMCQGIPFSRINEWLSSGRIEKVDRGVYALPNAKRDELALIQYRYDRCIFSGITALSIHGLSDHISESYHVTFPQGYNPSSLKDCGWNLSVTRSLPKIYDLGATTVTNEQGNEIRVYNRERSLCDILRGKGMPPFIVKTAMRRYFNTPDRDVDLLRSYSEKLHVKDRMESFIELY
ncbi:MAG: type IV toxin-antitoxin system AbiEi family antitoxin domain-containing protein [Candidatus Methanomethylophilaceae archaeon]|nr:type IV toxin-antitoxin system AbiEi family antitoxin domain-containing protein [Candidatus Methanomethylophilaceae archaeon]